MLIKLRDIKKQKLYCGIDSYGLLNLDRELGYKKSSRWYRNFYF